jgi:predicted RNase H-like nuclease (RuvC/YqgF family)
MSVQKKSREDDDDEPIFIGVSEKELNISVENAKLSTENSYLKKEIETLKAENKDLKEKLSRAQGSIGVSSGLAVSSSSSSIRPAKKDYGASKRYNILAEGLDFEKEDMEQLKDAGLEFKESMSKMDFLMNLQKTLENYKIAKLYLPDHVLIYQNIKLTEEDMQMKIALGKNPSKD